MGFCGGDGSGGNGGGGGMVAAVSTVTRFKAGSICRQENRNNY